MSAASDRLAAGFYNSNPYSPGANPGGLANGGHQINFPAALIDLGVVANEVGASIRDAVAAGIQPEFRVSGTWVQWRVGGSAWTNLIDSSLLGGIETGTWTPTIFGLTTAGTPTYGARQGRYIKIGKLVFITLYMVLNAKNDVAGGLTIGGLPFVVQGSIGSRATMSKAFWSGLSLPTGALDWFGYLLTTGFRLYYQTVTSGALALTDAHLAPTTTIYASSVYEAA